MATYILTDTPDDGEVKANQNGDGTANFWAETLIPFWSQFCAVKKYLRADSSLDLTKSLSNHTAGNGAALIGMPPTTIGGWTGGTLYAFLEAAFTMVVAGLAGKVAKAGDTVTGELAFIGSSARVRYREPVTLADNTAVMLTLNFDFAKVPNVSAPSIYTIPNVSEKGQWFVARRNVVGSGHNAAFARANTTTIGTLGNSAIGWIMFVSQDDGSGGVEWSAWAWGGGGAAFGS